MKKLFLIILGVSLVLPFLISGCEMDRWAIIERPYSQCQGAF
jgi:hypothetical protein